MVLKFTQAKFHTKFYVLRILWREIKYPKIPQNRLQKGLWSYMSFSFSIHSVNEYMKSDIEETAANNFILEYANYQKKIVVELGSAMAYTNKFAAFQNGDFDLKK